MVVEDRPSYRVISTRPIRPDGVDKVTGRAQYGADTRLAGMLYGRMKRSPHAHARITSIDVSKALALPGVKAVVTAADLPTGVSGSVNLGESTANIREAAENVLAHGKALYRGHAVAGVAATDVHTALAAVDLIEVEYELLPPVLDVRDAMRDDAPILDESRRMKSLAGVGDKPSNIAQHMQFAWGDVEQAFAEADVVVEREFTTKMVHQGYIEPHAATATWNEDGKITIWTSTQGSFAVRAATAGVLGVPVSTIKVIPTEIGGGFGGKLGIYVEPVAALLSKKTGRPVKIQMDRTEVFEGTGPTSGSYITVKMGARNDGTITAVKAMLAYEAGAYPGSSVGAGCQHCTVRRRQRRDRRLRRGREQAEDRRLPRTRCARRRLRDRAGGR